MIFTLYCIAKWLVLATMHTACGYFERETRPDDVGFRRIRIHILLSPLHLLFFVCLCLGYVKGVGAFCHEVLGYPLIFVLLEVPFMITIITIWALHATGWMIPWRQNIDERHRVLQALFR